MCNGLSGRLCILEWMSELCLEDEILAVASAWGSSATPEQARGVARFFTLLLQWNAHIDLTGARSFQDLLGEHLPDCFALSRLVPREASVVDIGSGGGLPAVPFAVLRPDCKMTLVEPRAKRTAFLSAALREVGGPFGFSLVRGRDDEIVEKFDVAMSRATFPPVEWLGRAGRLAREDGRIVVLSTEPQVTCSEYQQVAEVGYRTTSGSPRWAGAFVPRGTLPPAE